MTMNRNTHRHTLNMRANTKELSKYSYHIHSLNINHIFNKRHIL